MAPSLSMGHGGGCYEAMPDAMLRIAVALVVLLLVLEGTAVSSAKSSGLYRRGLLESTDNPRTIAVDLMHVQHVNSPYVQPNLTLTERVQISVANSKRRLQTTYVFTSPLESTQAAYIMQIDVGTPARTLVAIADTGSDLVWVQCSTCTNCLTIPDMPFDPQASSSYTSMSCTEPFCTDLPPPTIACPSTDICGYNYSYGDNTFTYGSMAYETFTFASSDGSTVGVNTIAFGCGTDDESTTFNNAADGLVGLGNGPLSLVSQLGSDIGSVFSYCLVDFSAATTQTSSLLLGSAGVKAKVYTPLVTNSVAGLSSFYYVNLLGITVNGQQVNYPAGTFDIDSTTGNGGIILDSGTTVTSLFDAAYTPFQSAISALINYPTASSTFLSLCYDTSSVSSPVFPNVVFQFESVNVALAPNNTFLAVDNQGTYCLAFQTAGPEAVNSVYGNIQQSNFEIAYDIGNKKIGFTPSTTC